MAAPTSSFEGDSLTLKSVLVALDKVIVIDSEDGENLKKSTIANVQTAILADGTIVTLAASQTLSNKTLLIPIITDFTAATHDHEDAAGGGTLLSAAISDIQTTITNNAEVLANTAKVTNATHSGDAIGDTILTISNNAVTFAKMQDINTASFIGRITAASGDPENLTGTQATTLLDLFTDALQGVVPLSGGGTDNFLRADGTWVPPPGAGVATQFTWGASDEDSPLNVGVLYTTEAAVVENTLSEVVLTLKNAPTGDKITVDIRKETAVNSNVFVTIFSTLPTIDINEFTSQTAAIPAVISDATWEIETRLQLVLTINDTNDVATGIKVTLA